MFFLFLIMVLWGPSICRADQTQLNEAEKLYQSGEIEKARQIYRAELDAPGAATKLPPSFFFNYGTILAKVGSVGEAYVTLMRAAFAQPFDSDIRHNLQRVEQTVPAGVRSVRPALWLGFWPNTFRFVSWQYFLLAGLVFSAVCLWAINFPDKTLSWGVGILAALLWCTSALSYMQTRLPVYGVLSIAQVKSGPGATFTDIATLEPGSLVNEDGSRDGWRKIRFHKGEMEETVGWVQPTALLEVLR